MWRLRTEREWNKFAEYYDHLTDAGLIPPWPPRELFFEVVDNLQPRSILDCACGSGFLLFDLAERGLRVVGSDVSPEMIALAQKNGERFKQEVPLVVAEWQELPKKLNERFDLICCLGNAISHCETRADRQASIYAMAEMLNPGGALMLDFRNWLKFRQVRERYTVLGPRYINGKRVILVWLNSFPESWHEPHVMEFIVIEDGEKQLHSDVYKATYFPFSAGELTDGLEMVGLKGVTVVPFNEEAGYFVFAAKPR